jgi:hypothetical protein
MKLFLRNGMQYKTDLLKSTDAHSLESTLEGISPRVNKYALHRPGRNGISQHGIAEGRRVLKDSEEYSVGLFD